MAEWSPFDAIREFEFDSTSYKVPDLTILEEEDLCELDQLPVIRSKLQLSESVVTSNG